MSCVAAVGMIGCPGVVVAVVVCVAALELTGCLGVASCAVAGYVAAGGLR